MLFAQRSQQFARIIVIRLIATRLIELLLFELFDFSGGIFCTLRMPKSEEVRKFLSSGEFDLKGSRLIKVQLYFVANLA